MNKRKKETELPERRHALRLWQVAHIKEGLRQADAGDFVDKKRVTAALARWKVMKEPGLDLLKHLVQF
jgi:predicted transcriptional regulator